MDSFIEVVKEKHRQEKMKVYQDYAGIDEVGVTSIAGSLVCSVVILPKEHSLPMLPIDSKVLDESKITDTAKKIEKQAVYYAILAVSPAEVDAWVADKTILSLQKQIWKKAISTVRKEFPGIHIVLDGKHGVDDCKGLSPVIGADGSYEAVSASAILSKYWCDERLREADKTFPQYLFAKHKGYPTKEHLNRIRKNGLCEIHRKNMAQKALDKPVKLKTYSLEKLEVSLIQVGELLKVNKNLTKESNVHFLRDMWRLVIKDKKLPTDKQQRFIMNLCNDIKKKYNRESKKQTN